MNKVYNCPCDTCSNKVRCGREALECKAVKQYYEKGWYTPSLVGMKLKPMKGYEKGNYSV